MAFWRWREGPVPKLVARSVMSPMNARDSQEQKSKKDLPQRYKPIGIKAVAAAVRSPDKKEASRARKPGRQGAGAAKKD